MLNKFLTPSSMSTRNRILNRILNNNGGINVAYYSTIVDNVLVGQFMSRIRMYTPPAYVFPTILLYCSLNTNWQLESETTTSCNSYIANSIKSPIIDFKGDVNIASVDDIEKYRNNVLNNYFPNGKLNTQFTTVAIAKTYIPCCYVDEVLSKRIDNIYDYIIYASHKLVK